ncbi:MAG: N-acetyltransferase protein [Chloroflexota bacterium]|nr:N-acetyltransferase protein [Chloroflexota bacterium]
MAVFALNRHETREPGVYPFNPRKHLRQVADLVGAVFAAELDAEGRNALQEVQAIGWLSPVFGGLLSSTFLGEFVGGYVWIEGGQVLGNVTLQRNDYSGTRWRISNVAVAPKHRGLGIGRSLMLAGLSEIAQQNGSWAILQVRPDNPPARRLYESLGFSAVCQDGVWRLPARPTEIPAPEVQLRRLPALAWRARLDLAQAAQTPLASWANPVAAEAYQTDPLQALGEMIGGWLGLYRVQRWGASSHGRLDGAVEIWASALGDAHRLRLLVRPEARGHLERALVGQGLRALATAPYAPVIAEHSGDHPEGIAALEAAGFRAQRMLLTMRRPIVPADALL